MSTPNTFVVSLPLEAQELLAENGIDIATALRGDGLQVSRGALPADAPESDGSKEIVLTLVAIGLTSTMVAAGIAKVLDAIGRNKKFVVTEQELVPAIDGKGKPIKGPDGKPVMQWSEKKKLLEPQQTTSDKFAVSSDVRPTRLKFSLTSGK